jgi:hypothetical protein
VLGGGVVFSTGPPISGGPSWMWKLPPPSWEEDPDSYAQALAALQPIRAALEQASA